MGIVSETNGAGKVAQAAMRYAAMGWRLVPLHNVLSTGACSCSEGINCREGSRGKHPRFGNDWQHAASGDEDTVAGWFAMSPNANLGLLLGPESGLVDVEFDSDEGARVAQKMFGGGCYTPTYTSQRSTHRIFRYSDKLPAKAVVESHGIEIRIGGKAAQSVLPPSRHWSGVEYVWLPGLSPDEVEPLELPEWVVELANGRTPPELGSPNSLNSPSGLVFTVGESPDLATAAGVNEPGRRNRALELIGSAIARGVDPVDIANQAVAWAGRCSPAFPEDEALGIVADLLQKNSGKVVAANDEPLPAAKAWPSARPEAFYGLAGEIVRAVEPESESDPLALLVQVLVTFGSMVGRKPHSVVEGTSHGTNLFTVLVGQTAKGRKGTSEGRVRSIIRMVDEKFVLDQIQTGLVSGEGLIHAVRDPLWQRQAIKEKGVVVDYQEVEVDAGIEDKRLLVVEPEYASVLRVCKRESNTLSPTLRSAWDNGNLRTMAKNSPSKATNAHISVIGHITLDELRATLAQVEIFNGLANRSLWLCVKRSKLLPDGGGDLDLSAYIEGMQSVYEYARGVERMKRDTAATKRWREVYVELSQARGGLLGAVTNRAEAQVLRLSMVYALLDKSAVVRIEHLEAAKAVWDYAAESAAYIFGDTPANTTEAKVLALVRQSPGLSRRELYKALSGHAKAEAVVPALVNLRDQGLIHVEPVITGGRPGERYFPGAVGEQREQSEQSPQGGDLCSLNSLCSQPKVEQIDTDTDLCSHKSLCSQADAASDGEEDITI